MAKPTKQTIATVSEGVQHCLQNFQALADCITSLNEKQIADFTNTHDVLKILVGRMTNMEQQLEALKRDAAKILNQDFTLKVKQPRKKIKSKPSNPKPLPIMKSILRRIDKLERHSHNQRPDTKPVLQNANTIVIYGINEPQNKTPEHLQRKIQIIMNIIQMKSFEAQQTKRIGILRESGHCPVVVQISSNCDLTLLWTLKANLKNQASTKMIFIEKWRSPVENKIHQALVTKSKEFKTTPDCVYTKIYGNKLYVTTNTKTLCYTCDENLRIIQLSH